MSYSSIDGGYTPLTRSQMLTILFESAVANGYTGSFQDFKGSNIHRIHSDTTLPYLESMQADFADAIMAMFSFFNDNRGSVYGSYGSSLEGWQNNFVNNGLCRGLYIVDSNIDDSLGVAGNIALYFDMLDEKKLDEVEKAWLKCVWPGMLTPRGDHSIDVEFSTVNGKKTYKYHNLKEEDYTELDIKIIVKYKTNSIHYPNASIIASVREQFDLINHIGRHFYPQSYFDHALLPNIADMEVWSSLSTTIDYSNQIRLANFGQKYIIKNAQVEVK